MMNQYLRQMIETGSRVAWQGTDGRLHLGTVDEITGSRAVVIEMAISRRAGKVTTKPVRWSVVLTELQVQDREGA